MGTVDPGPRCPLLPPQNLSTFLMEETSCFLPAGQRGENEPPRGFLRHSLIILRTRLRDKQASAEKTVLCYLITHRERRFAYSKRKGGKKTPASEHHRSI